MLVLQRYKSLIPTKCSSIGTAQVFDALTLCPVCVDLPDQVAYPMSNQFDSSQQRQCLDTENILYKPNRKNKV